MGGKGRSGGTGSASWMTEGEGQGRCRGEEEVQGGGCGNWWFVGVVWVGYHDRWRGRWSALRRGGESAVVVEGGERVMNSPTEVLEDKERVASTLAKRCSKSEEDPSELLSEVMSCLTCLTVCRAVGRGQR